MRTQWSFLLKQLEDYCLQFPPDCQIFKKMLQNVTKRDNLNTTGDSYYNYYAYLKNEAEQSGIFFIQNHAFDNFLIT